MPHTWTTQPNGVVVVDGGVPQLQGAEKARLQRVTAQWKSTFAPIAKKAGVPLNWMLAFCAVESGGNPKAISPAGAVGLLQLMPMWWRGQSQTAMFDPIRNATYGAELLAAIRKTQSQLPVVASVYNCGADNAKNNPRPRDNAWGMCAAAGYIDDVIAGNNTLLLERGAAQGATNQSNAGSSAALLAVGAIAFTGFLASIRR